MSRTVIEAGDERTSRTAGKAQRFGARRDGGDASPAPRDGLQCTAAYMIFSSVAVEGVNSSTMRPF